MEKKYRVVFIGLRESREDFQVSMSRLGVPSDKVAQIISGAPITLKADLSLGAAREYADALQRAGGRVNIQEDGLMEGTKRYAKEADVKSLQEFFMCPQCGHKQLRATHCSKCGKSYEEYSPSVMAHS